MTFNVKDRPQAQIFLRFCLLDNWINRRTQVSLRPVFYWQSSVGSNVSFRERDVGCLKFELERNV
jgi:hypothetical protein